MSLPLLGRSENSSEHPQPRTLPPWLLPLPPRSPSERAWREAYGDWARARDAAIQEIERLEEWDPAVDENHWHRDALRRLMAGDRTGDLRLARSAATQAARLARTPHERFQAALLLSRIDCDLGHHRAELEQAWVLIRLAPHNEEALAVMQRAARHHGSNPVERSRARSGHRSVSARRPASRRY